MLLGYLYMVLFYGFIHVIRWSLIEPNIKNKRIDDLTRVHT